MTPSNSGSRNTIITWAIVATILGIGSLIWAVISFTQANKAQKDLLTEQAKFKNAVILNSQAVTDVQAVKDDASRNFASKSLLEVSRQQTEDLTRLVGGASATDDRKATIDAQAVIEAAKKAAGTEAAIDSTSLTSAISSLTTYVGTLKTNDAKLADDLKAATASVAAAQKEKADVVAASDQKVADAVKQATDSQANADAYAKTKDQQLSGVQENLKTQTGLTVMNANDLNNRINALQQNIATTTHENEDLKGQLKNFRVPTNQIIQQADGVISRVEGTDRVFINLGKGDQIAAGMTFEVYDKLGVPRVTSQEPADDKLLKGKASIEVVKVQNGISECRVVRLAPATTVTEGDPIVNVVYDKHVKFNFFVFGKFNLDYKGDATDADTDIVRRLISSWGAQVTDRLDTKTDFVVLGEEPVVPTYTQDEIAREPEKAFQKEQAEQALEQYTDLKGKAVQLNIPILNQTRFLYMIGYYEEAGR